MDDWPDHDYNFTKPPLSDRYDTAAPAVLAVAFLVAAIAVLTWAMFR